MENNIVIGIEGLVGAGKTSICRELLKQIPNSILLHGGNLYRAIIFAFMKYGNIDISSLKENIQNIDARQLMEKLKIELKVENNETVIYIAGDKIDEEKLQSSDASLAVSIAGKEANNLALYQFARQIIEKFKLRYNVIVSGRALMEIYPELDYHFLVTASLEERINRKYIQYKGEVSKEKIKENIIKRDELQEKSGYYKKYDKTITVDVTDCKTVEESTQKILEYIKL